MFNREATKSMILDGIEWRKEYMLTILNSWRECIADLIGIGVSRHLGVD